MPEQTEIHDPANLSRDTVTAFLAGVAWAIEEAAKIEDYTAQSAEMCLAEGGEYDGIDAARHIADEIRRIHIRGRAEQREGKT